MSRSSSGASPPVCLRRRRRIHQTPTTAVISAANAVTAISGSSPRQVDVRERWVMPAATMPTTRPSAVRTGAMVRMDGPRVPVYVSVIVSPRRAASMLPM